MALLKQRIFVFRQCSPSIRSASSARYLVISGSVSWPFRRSESVDRGTTHNDRSGYSLHHPAGIHVIFGKESGVGSLQLSVPPLSSFCVFAKAAAKCWVPSQPSKRRHRNNSRSKPFRRLSFVAVLPHGFIDRSSLLVQEETYRFQIPFGQQAQCLLSYCCKR